MGKIVEKSFKKSVLKSNSWNLQCVIKVVNHFSDNKILSPGGYLSLSLGYINVLNCIIFVCLFLWNRLSNFHQISHWAFCWKAERGLLLKGSISLNGSATLNKMVAMPIYGKTFKNHLLQNQESFRAEFWYITPRTLVLPSLFKWRP